MGVATSYLSRVLPVSLCDTFVIDTVAEVYWFDKKAQDQQLQSDQENRADVADTPEFWLAEHHTQKLVEPNSSLDDAMYYLLVLSHPLLLLENLQPTIIRSS